MARNKFDEYAFELALLNEDFPGMMKIAEEAATQTGLYGNGVIYDELSQLQPQG